MMLGCSGGENFSQLAEQFVYGSLALSPVAATAAGLHQYEGKNLDQMLDDIGVAGIDRQRTFYRHFQQRLAKIRRDRLSLEDQTDYDIIQDQIALALLDFDKIQSYAHNPTLYVELIGNALFTPYVLEYAPKADRMRHIVARLRQLPIFVDQARMNLVSAPPIWTKVAIEENAGNVDLVKNTLAAAMPADLRKEYDAASQIGLKALQDLQEFLQKQLTSRTGWDWRLGKDKYYEKFRYYLQTDQDPSVVLAQAERDLQSMPARMLELAAPLYQKMYPGAKETDPKLVISQVLAKIAEKHATPDTYMAEAKRDLQEARAFVAQKHLLTLPPRDNLQVIETPEFMRGIYAVGGFNSAPVLEPQLGAFYWVTPIPKNWPQQRIESKLREYNFYKLKLLTIHEAMPGHYVQLEIANEIEPKTRRVLRSVFGNNPYIEGWAQYATQMMLDAGFLDNAPELRLTFLKEELRVLANAIIDIRLHALDMTDQEALDLMQKQTFQEEEEATAKLQRAKLSSCQLPTYLVGWRGWIRVRDQYRQAHPGASLQEFNDRALKEGAVPLPLLPRLLEGK